MKNLVLTLTILSILSWVFAVLSIQEDWQTKTPKEVNLNADKSRKPLILL